MEPPEFPQCAAVSLSSQLGSASNAKGAAAALNVAVYITDDAFNLDDSTSFVCEEVPPFKNYRGKKYLHANIQDPDSSVDEGPRLPPHYIFTRFYLRQTLVAAGVLPSYADSVAATIKQEFIEGKIESVTHKELESRVFWLLLLHKFYSDAENLKRLRKNFRLMCRFSTARGAVVLFVFGTPCLSHTITSVRLAERLNVPNVVRTDIVANVLSYPVETPHLPTGESPDDIINHFKAMCDLVHKGLSADLEKARDHGKALLVEGYHVDPVRCLNAQQLLDDSEPYTTRTSRTAYTQQLEGGRYPVVIVSFLLKGQPRDFKPTQDRSTPISQSSEIMRSIHVINRYFESYIPYLHTIPMDDNYTTELSDAALATMQDIVITTLERHARSGRF